MKKIALILIMLLFLWGCGSSSETIVVEPETTPTETAVVTAEPEPVATAVEPEPAPVVETPTETVTEETPVTTPTEPVTSTTHTIQAKVDGFSPKELTIKTGDTVVWENVRQNANLNKAFIIGTQGVCRTMKSKMYLPNETFSYTFNEAGKCTYVDGIYITLIGKITVE